MLRYIICNKQRTMSSPLLSSFFLDETEENRAKQSVVSMAGSRSDKDGLVAKAAGLVVLGGVAWSFYKSVAPLILLNSRVPHGQSYHIIQGDTLFSIARSNGVSVEALKAANDLHEDDIYAGDTIIIPK